MHKLIYIKYQQCVTMLEYVLYMCYSNVYLLAFCEFPAKSNDKQSMTRNPISVSPSDISLDGTATMTFIGTTDRWHLLKQQNLK